MIEIRITESELNELTEQLLSIHPKAAYSEVRTQAFLDLCSQKGIYTNDEFTIVGKMIYSKFVLVTQ